MPAQHTGACATSMYALVGSAGDGREERIRPPARGYRCCSPDRGIGDADFSASVFASVACVERVGTVMRCVPTHMSQRIWYSLGKSLS